MNTINWLLELLLLHFSVPGQYNIRACGSDVVNIRSCGPATTMGFRRPDTRCRTSNGVGLVRASSRETAFDFRRRRRYYFSYYASVTVTRCTLLCCTVRDNEIILLYCGTVLLLRAWCELNIYILLCYCIVTDYTSCMTSTFGSIFLVEKCYSTSAIVD